MQILRKIFAIFYPESSLDTDLRYKPIVSFLREKLKDKPKILEVGSGSAGITRYLNYPLTGVDKAFSKPSRLVKQVKVSGVKLPFENDSFDFVISVDMLEHVPGNKRESAIKEMVRVAKKVLILAVPCGVKAEIQDKGLFEYYLKNHGQEEEMLKEHLQFGLPKVKEINKFIKNSGKKVSIKIVPHVNLSLRSFYMKSFFSASPLFRKISWLLLPLSHFDRFLNFSDCYRQIFFIKMLESERD